MHRGIKKSASQSSSDHNLPVAVVEMWALNSISGECGTELEPLLFFILVIELFNREASYKINNKKLK